MNTISRRKWIKQGALLVPASMAGLSGILEAQTMRVGGTARVGTITRGAAAARSFTLKETFEGTGYSNSGWSETASGGTIDEDYTTSPAPLSGSQSLRFVSTASKCYIDRTMTAMSTVYGRFMWRQVTAVPSDDSLIFQLRETGGSSIFEIYVRGSGGGTVMRCIDGVSGTVNGATSTQWTNNTTYYIWFKYSKGSGANAFGSVAFNTTLSEPTNGDGKYGQYTTGTATQDVTNPQPQMAGGTLEAIWDDFYLDTTASIGTDT